MQHLASLCLTPKVDSDAYGKKIDQEQGCLALLDSRAKNCIELNTRNPEKKMSKMSSPFTFWISNSCLDEIIWLARLR